MRVINDRLFLYRLGRSVAVCAAVLALMGVSGLARADATVYVDSTGQAAIGRAPNGSTVYGSHINPSGLYGPNGEYRFSNPLGAGSGPTPQYRNTRYMGGAAGGFVHGVKELNVVMKDTYGATAQGKITTSTQMPPTSRMAQGLGGLIVADMAVNHLGNLKQNGAADQFVRGMENGSWSDVAAAVGKLFDWTGIGSRLNANLNNDAIPTAPLQQQSEAKARQLYDNYQASKKPIDPAAYKQYSKLTITEWGGNLNLVRTIIIPSNSVDWTMIQSQNYELTFPMRFGDVEVWPQLPAEKGNWIQLYKTDASAADIIRYNEQNAPTIDQVLPGEAAIINLLAQLLNDTNRNNTDLLNAITGSGVANAGNTTTTVDSNNVTNNTFLTSAYTPAGTNTPQQTQFKVQADGSVTATTIPRPDLAPHSSQAPTRAEIPTAPIPGSPSTTTPGETKPTEPATASAPDICSQNPKSAMCADLGNADYEDPVIPSEQRKLDFQPANIFNTSGICPRPLSFDVMSKSFQISYQPMCDFAGMVRPMIIMMAMVISMGMAYSATRSL
ncbi:virulence factor TspB C-terminal domain-related protein [Paralysiella testudinis]|uniref:virulence factor TspB C-terminal domain-related protein n=1 Tax=Paralysiella testudinis TaxID=2809020 RepID=UPI00362FBD8C